MRKRARRKKPTKAQLAAKLAAERRDWNVRQEILFRVERCQRCGSEPGPLHVPTHRAWLDEVLALGAMLALPSRAVTPHQKGSQ